MTDTCVCCGAPVPEGRQVCPMCETWSFAPDAFLPDGTPLYFKTACEHVAPTVQLELYQQLLGYKRAMQKED
jgi:hypothetical protein